MDLNWQFTILIMLCLSIIAGFLALQSIKTYIPLFLQRGLFGYDQCKIDKCKIPEPFGVVVAAVYLICVFLFIPLFSQSIIEPNKFISLMAGLLSICTAILLGFGDDMLDLRWRHKLIFPFLSSLPLVLVYYLSGSSTAMHLPIFFQRWFSAMYIDFGMLYYGFIIALVVFCTNAINIIAGINGVECGQSLIIALSIAIYNSIQIFRLGDSLIWNSCISLSFILPFITTSFALFLANKYPAMVFVGDTYTYWAGMTFAVCAITGHFSKTLLLFLIPQILNFLYSCPQLFHMIPCPRHRLPKLNSETGLLGMSMVDFQPGKLDWKGTFCLKVLRMMHLIYYEEFEKDDERCVKINNLTILNFLLRFIGPIKEGDLTNAYLIVQIAFSLLAFAIRFYLPKFLYEHVY